LVERLGRPIRIVHGTADNIKITMPEDLVLAETLLDYGRGRNMRIGTGIDVHTFMAERKLMLGCVEVPFERGLAGHSDADVLAHALCDAILGAAGLGDIGQHFPDDAPEWAGAAGKRLLGLTMDKVRSAGYELESADVTLLAERPKIKNFKDNMVQAMAEAMSVDRARLNVKATTTEGLGAIGREEGLAAMAVALLRQRPIRSER
jgi:2-C-methyl-D-erythritol 4-phosphate cytidylyltransferase/2-C-methyl-D-erythritol 2,4-cyclodiphosphate synthase